MGGSGWDGGGGGWARLRSRRFKATEGGQGRCGRGEWGLERRIDVGEERGRGCVEGWSGEGRGGEERGNR